METPRIHKGDRLPYVYGYIVRDLQHRLKMSDEEIRELEQKAIESFERSKKS